MVEVVEGERWGDGGAWLLWEEVEVEVEEGAEEEEWQGHGSGLDGAAPRARACCWVVRGRRGRLGADRRGEDAAAARCLRLGVLSVRDNLAGRSGGQLDARRVEAEEIWR